MRILNILLILILRNFKMTQVLIDKKKYVIIPIKEYELLQKKAALKSKPEKLFSIEEARAYSKIKINKWAAEKLL